MSWVKNNKLNIPNCINILIKECLLGHEHDMGVKMFFKWNVSIEPEPWEEWVERVVIHVPHYLSYDAEKTAGGRQRTVRDVASIVKNTWKKEIVILQKAKEPFIAHDDNNNLVIGLRSKLNVYGDIEYGYKTSKYLEKGDAILYMGQEDAWPFFVNNGKAIHTGVWWDGPFNKLKLKLNRVRSMGFFEAMRSVLSVDTNVINWLRCQGRRGYDLANKVEYIPNCVDLEKIPSMPDRLRPGEPIKILFARRYETKRGGELYLDALKMLKEKGIPFIGILSSAIGQEGSDVAKEHIKERGLENCIHFEENDIDTVMNAYRDVDIAVIPTLWSEGTSYSCIEAIAAGIPVIATPVGGLGNLIFPDYNGIIAAPTPEAIASAIIRASEPALWRVMHQNCLSMRVVLSKEIWDQRVLQWLKM